MSENTPERAALKAKDLAARARDAALATREYEEKRLALLARTERLRAERLQRDAEAARENAREADLKRAAPKSRKRA